MLLEHRHARAARNDHMVDERGPHEIARAGHPLGKLDIFDAWRGIAAWMIVHEDERARPFS